MTDWTSPEPGNPAVGWRDEHGVEHPVPVSGPGLTDQEWESIACACDSRTLCPIHHEDADSHIEFNTVELYTRIDRVLAARGVSVQADNYLRAAVERVRALTPMVSDEWPTTGAWLNRADVLDALAASPAPTYVWTRNDQTDHDAGHPSGYDCNGYAMTGSEACATRYLASPAPAEDRECERCGDRITRQPHDWVGSDGLSTCAKGDGHAVRGVGSDVIERVLDQARKQQVTRRIPTGPAVWSITIAELEGICAALAPSTPEDRHLPGCDWRGGPICAPGCPVSGQETRP